MLHLENSVIIWHVRVLVQQCKHNSAFYIHHDDLHSPIFKAKRNFYFENNNAIMNQIESNTRPIPLVIAFVTKLKKWQWDILHSLDYVNCSVWSQGLLNIFLLSRHTRNLTNQADKIRLNDKFPFLSNLFFIILLNYLPSKDRTWKVLQLINRYKDVHIFEAVFGLAFLISMLFGCLIYDLRLCIMYSEKCKIKAS
jgi:hypothetical protein